MTRLLLIRHGEPLTSWGDGADPGLSERGHAQALASAARVADFAPAALMSSPLARCRETATPVEAVLQQTSTIEARVGEVVAPDGVADRRAWLAETFPWRVGAVPTLWKALDPRLAAWRASVLDAVMGCGADTAIFTHFIAINAIVSAALERADTIVCRPDFASVTKLALEDGRLRLVALGAQMSEGEVR